MKKKGSLTQKIRWLTHALILSGVLNVLFLGIFFYFLVRENPFPLAYDYAPVQKKTEEFLVPDTLLQKLAALPFEKLQSYLHDKTYVEEGYETRDFALALLAYRDHVDIRRALGQKNLSERKWKISQQHMLTLYPDLRDEDFLKISTFLSEERWPFTSFGLYTSLKKQGKEVEASLLQAFCLTPEFLALEVLFSRTGVPIKKGTILALACESTWPSLQTLVESQKKGADFSDSTRREFLLKALDAKSPTAAYLFLLTDYSFALRQISDEQMLALLSLLKCKTPESANFAKEVALSKRSDGVLNQAAQCLLEYGIVSEKPTAARFDPRPGLKELRPVFRDQPPPTLPNNVHVIKPGESLWIIAKKYGVSIEKLVEYNRLPSTTLQPGKTLKIP